MIIRNTIETKLVSILTAEEIRNIAISEVCGLDTIDEGLKC